jgi:hypothetical protein
MFFPVTVYDSNGKVKTIITPQSLGKRHWAEFGKNKNNLFVTRKNKQIPRLLKDSFDLVDLEFKFMR